MTDEETKRVMEASDKAQEEIRNLKLANERLLADYEHAKAEVAACDRRMADYKYQYEHQIDGLKHIFADLEEESSRREAEIRRLNGGLAHIRDLAEAVRMNKEGEAE